MRDGAYLKRLGADLERWRMAGAVTADQATSLYEEARIRADVSQSSPAAVAAALGAILFGLGLITFIAANWGVLPKSARMFAALFLIWLTFGGVIIALERNAKWIGHSFALAGALAIGAAVALVGQTYHIEGSAAGLFFIWMIGAGITAIAFRSTPVLILYVILAFAWFALSRPDMDFIFNNSRASAKVWNVYGFEYLPFLFIGAFLGRRWDSGAAMHLSGLNLAFWLALFFGNAIWGGFHRDWLAAGLMIAASGAAIAAAGEYVRFRLGERAGAITLAWGSAITLGGMIIAQFAVREHQPVTVQMIYAAAALALCTWGINWGETPGRRAVRALAVAGFVFECFYIYVSLFQGLLDTSLFLLGGGALLFALAFAMRFITKKKQPLPATPTGGAAP